MKSEAQRRGVAAGALATTIYAETNNWAVVIPHAGMGGWQSRVLDQPAPVDAGDRDVDHVHAAAGQPTGAACYENPHDIVMGSSRALLASALRKLEVESLTVSYAHLTAVRDVSLTVQEGEVVALGANAAGKSSVLKAIGGVVPSAPPACASATETSSGSLGIGGPRSGSRWSLRIVGSLPS